MHCLLIISRILNCSICKKYIGPCLEGLETDLLFIMIFNILNIIVSGLCITNLHSLLYVLPSPFDVEMTDVASFRDGPLLIVACGRDTISIASSIKKLASENVFVVQVC